MSWIIDNYSFDSITPYESIIDFPRPTSHIFPETSSNQSIAILPSINEPTPAQIEHTFWRPSDTLLKVLRRLHEIDYTQFPCVPCSYCSRLLYPNQIKWITRQTNYIFPFEHVYPHIPLTTHPRNSTKVAVCPHVNYHLTHVSKTYLMANENICRPYIYTRALACIRLLRIPIN